MSQAVGIVGKIVVAGVILGIAGFFLGRYAARRSWELERARLVTDNEFMTSELNVLKDYVRKKRQAANELRARINPRSTMPATTTMPPYPMFSTSRPVRVQDGLAPIPPWAPPTPVSRPVRQPGGTRGPRATPTTGSPMGR